MADLGEAFNSLNFYKKPFQTIDYFFTQMDIITKELLHHMKVLYLILWCLSKEIKNYLLM